MAETKLSTAPLGWSPAEWHGKAMQAIVDGARDAASHHEAVAAAIHDLAALDGCLPESEVEALTALSAAAHAPNSAEQRAAAVRAAAAHLEHPTQVAQVIIGIAVDSAARTAHRSGTESARMVSADVGGAVAGARTGAAIGGLLGNAIGGAVIGGLVGGAVASARAAKE